MDTIIGTYGNVHAGNVTSCTGWCGRTVMSAHVITCMRWPRSSTWARQACPKSGCARLCCRHWNTRPFPASKILHITSLKMGLRPLGKPLVPFRMKQQRFAFVRTGCVMVSRCSTRKHVHSRIHEEAVENSGGCQPIRATAESILLREERSSEELTASTLPCNDGT